MATVPAIHTLVDDTDTVIIVINIPPDSPDEVVLTTIADPSTFPGGGRTPTYLAVRRIQWSLMRFSVLLWADADTDVLVGTLCEGYGNFNIPGPRPILDVGAGSTGLVKMTTLNRLGPTGSGVVVIEFDKRGNA